MHKTSAWPLALLYGALIVFASLFPFSGWRAQGVAPWAFLLAPLPPPYWTKFDVFTNLLGYAPLGFLLALALLRTGVRARWAFGLATLAGRCCRSAWSFCRFTCRSACRPTLICCSMRWARSRAR